ncbi:MAG: hypothetical protein GY878_27225 [Fuerstiella sp.]|nr:hypothetical protein [Fuerstiella sp.]
MTEDDASPSSSGEIDRILVDYFRRIDAGEQISVEKFVAEHPDHAATLSDLLHAEAEIRARGDADDDPTDPRHTPTVVGVSSDTTAHSPDSVLRYFGDYELLEEIARGGNALRFACATLKVCLWAKSAKSWAAAKKRSRRPTRSALYSETHCRVRDAEVLKVTGQRNLRGSIRKVAYPKQGSQRNTA